MQKWEYKTVATWNERVMNAYGSNGWELVATTGSGYDTLCYFKRPVELEVQPTQEGSSE